MFSFEEIWSAIQLLSPAVTLAVCTFLAIIVIYQNQNKEINRVFFFWMVVSALNAFFFLFALLLNSTTLLWVSIIVGSLDACIGIHFILLFTFVKKWISHRWTVVLVYMPAMIIMMLAASYFIVGIDPLGIVLLYLLFMNLMEFLAIVLLIITFVKIKDKTTRMQLVFIGIGILFITLGFFLSIFIGIVISQNVGNLLVAIYVPLASMLLAVAVLRFRIMDVSEVIKKGILFSLLSFIIVTLFILLGEGLEFFFEGRSILGLKIPGILTAVIIALLIIPLQNQLEKLINKFFPKKESAHIRQMRLDTYRTALSEALEDGKTTKREEKLLDRVRESLDITPGEDTQIRRELFRDEK